MTLRPWLMILAAFFPLAAVLTATGQETVKAETEPWNYYERDWTDGCIALKNSDMDLVWEAVDPGIPIDIRP